MIYLRLELVRSFFFDKSVDKQKYMEDARQDEKHVPDLLESIMRPTDPVKEELRPILFKMVQIGSKIKKIRVSTFWIP